MAILRHLSVAAALTILNLPWYTGPIAQADTVGDHLWIWGHPAGSYNDGFLRPMKLVSKIEPVDAALYMGLKNLIFVRYSDKPAPTFDAYYNPFRKLDRVYWSLVGAGGGSSSAEREAAFTLAEKNKNLAGFILDDFFHEQCEGNAADPLGIVDSPDRPLRTSLDPAQLRTPPAAGPGPEATVDGRDLHPPGKARRAAPHRRGRSALHVDMAAG